VGRTVSAVVTFGGEVLGAVGPFAVPLPWWSEAGSAAERFGEALGVPVLILRLLRVEGGDAARDGHVTYHVEALHRPVRPPAPVRRPPPGCTGDETAAVTPHELRAPWARIDGLRELLGWASRALAARGRPLTGPVRQHRTWNLAGLFRLPTARGPVWLKATPHFAADEAAVIAAFARAGRDLVPAVVAAGERRVLLEHLPGEDCWDASAETITGAVRRLVAAQAALRHDPVASVLPDRRTPALRDQIRALLDRDIGLDAAEREAARGLLRHLPALDECGLPDTLVHGDFHPGNWRADGGPPVVLDFADAYFGSPVLDGRRTADFLPEGKRPIARKAWVDAWRSAMPGCDPARAMVLGEIIAPLVYAVRYQEFLDGIEPAERVYHRDDPMNEVRAALRKSFENREQIALR
jgi:Ser/Thr protein kinase RdoA (MazF antagonist)